MYVRSIGRPARGTVLTLHGGPGATHDYLLPLADLSARGYQVVFYDQLGCGRSEVPRNSALFTVERYVEEVEALRRKLHLGRVHLMGSSWGGLLALAYALRHPQGLQSLVTIGGLASVPFAAAEMARLRRRLPSGVRRELARYESQGAYHAPGYLRAVDTFYRRHLCRLWPWPPEVQRSLAWVERRPVYPTMNGPNEFTITGTLRYWDCTARLGDIRTPTMVTGGRHDEVTPRVARQIHEGIAGSEWVTFRESAHLPFWEERARFRSVVGEFLDRHAAG
ncbi:MAG TPA: proline iminopeptidase-family hydrolase [Thermoplasmata archaeon]|nr:proline iminopeptidase-family hydrolase [Thermoplasmata archaeon]